MIILKEHVYQALYFQYSALHRKALRNWSALKNCIIFVNYIALKRESLK